MEKQSTGVTQKNQNIRNREKLEHEAKIRCANFIIEMIKKYGSGINRKGGTLSNQKHNQMWANVLKDTQNPEY